jgi:hypothetical protein
LKFVFFFQASCGLRIQDLQEAKDLLLVETADMLQLPLFTAEALLRNYGIDSSLISIRYIYINIFRMVKRIATSIMD